MSRLLLPLQSVLLAVVLTWPGAARLATEAVGSADTDTPKHVWTMWWMRREALAGVPGLRTTFSNWPDGLSLFPIAPLDGLVALVAPLPPLLLANLLAIAHLALLGLCAGWLGGLVAGTRRGALVAGALAQGCAFASFSLHVGAGELRELWWIPLGLACLVRAHRTRATRDFALLGAALAGAVFACFYHGLFLAVATATWALATLERDPRLLRGYALAAGLALLLTVPVVHVFSDSYGSAVHITAPYASASLDELFVPSRDPARYGGGRYLGLGALLLAGLAVATAPRKAAPWLAVLGVSAVLALGPFLRVGDVPVQVDGQVFALPYAALDRFLALVGQPLNFPGRFVAPGMIALAVLGAVATGDAPRLAPRTGTGWWRLALVPLALADQVALDRTPWPRATWTPADMSALAAVPLDPRAPAVADLSSVLAGDPSGRNLAIAAQLVLDRPFASVPIERHARAASGGADWLKALPLVQALSHPVGGAAAATPTDAGDYRADLALLRDRGFGTILLTHRRDSPDLSASGLLTRLCGDPVRAAHAALWTIPDAPASPDDLAAWHAEQSARVERRP